MEELIFSVEAHSSKELRHFKFISMSFMAQLLGSASFIGKVNDAPPAIPSRTCSVTIVLTPQSNPVTPKY